MPICYNIKYIVLLVSHVMGVFHRICLSTIILDQITRPFLSKCGEEGSGDSGQDVLTQWNAIMGILCKCLLAMRADRTYPTVSGDCCMLFFDTKTIFFDLARNYSTIDNTSIAKRYLSQAHVSYSRLHNI